MSISIQSINLYLELRKHDNPGNDQSKNTKTLSAIAWFALEKPVLYKQSSRKSWLMTSYAHQFKEFDSASKAIKN